MAPHLLSGCSSVEIKDEIFYGNKGALGATELHTLVSGQKDFTKAQWDQILLSQPLVCTSIQTFGDIKSSIEKLCSLCNCCDYNTKAALETFYTNLSQVKVGGK